MRAHCRSADELRVSSISFFDSSRRRTDETNGDGGPPNALRRAADSALVPRKFFCAFSGRERAEHPVTAQIARISALRFAALPHQGASHADRDGRAAANFDRCRNRNAARSRDADDVSDGNRRPRRSRRAPPVRCRGDF
jgi:hypothetical protein